MQFNVRYEVLCEEQESLRSYEPPNLHRWVIEKKTLKGKKFRTYIGVLSRKEFDKFVSHCGLVAHHAIKDTPRPRPVNRVAFSNVITNRVVAWVDVHLSQRSYTKTKAGPTNADRLVARMKRLADIVMKVYGGAA